MAKRSWLVKASLQKLPLALEGEEWIEVKSELTTGEARRVDRAGIGNYKITRDSPTMEANIDWEQAETTRILAWCTDWSFVDHNEKPLELNLENLNAIDREAFEAVTDALDEYIKAKAKEKKATSGSAGRSRSKRISA